VYDILHSTETRREVRALLRMEAAVASLLGGEVPPKEGRVWLEPACGSGRLLRAASAHGIDGIGFDIAPAMIGYARACATRVKPMPTPPPSRRASPRAASITPITRIPPRFFVASMRDFDDVARGEPDFAPRGLPPASLAFNLINTIRHITSDAEMLAHLAAVARTLAPRAAYLVGISLSSYGNEVETEDVWTGARAGVRVTQVIQYLPPSGRRGEASRAERVISHLTVTDSNAGPNDPVECHIDETYALRAYDLRQWRDIIERSALEVVATFDTDGNPTTPVEPGYAVHALARRDRPRDVRPTATTIRPSVR
jgi:hypothetical protein